MKPLKRLALRCTVVMTLALGVVPGAWSQALPTDAEATLDLRDWHPEKGELRTLDGEWDFYWKQFLEPGSSSTGSPRFRLEVPGFWNNLSEQGRSLGAQGWGSYRLKVLVPENAPELALKIPSISSSYRLYVNEKETVAMGNPGKDRDSTIPANVTCVSPLPANARTLDILFQVANFTSSWGGIRNPLVIGERRNLEAELTASTNIMLLMTGVMVMGAFFFLVLFLSGAESRSAAFLAGFCISVAINTVFGGEFYNSSIVQHLTWQDGAKLEYLSYYLAFLALTLYFNDSHPRYFVRAFKKIVLAVMMVLIADVLVSDYEHYSWQLTLFEVGVAVATAYFLYIQIREVIRRSALAWVSLFGYLAVFVAVAIELSRNNEFFLLYFHYSIPYGLFVFSLSQMIVLAWRYAALKRETELTAEDRLLYSQRLEREVEQRTKELMQADRDRVQLFQRIAEETRTPLTIVKNNLETYAESRDPSSELTSIQKGIHELLAVVTGYLDSDATAPDRSSFVHETGCDLPQVIRALAQQVRHGGSVQKPTIVVRETLASIPVRMASEALYQVLHNLFELVSQCVVEGTFITIESGILHNRAYFCLEDLANDGRLDRVFEARQASLLSILDEVAGTLVTESVGASGVRVRVALPLQSPAQPEASNMVTELSPVDSKKPMIVLVESNAELVHLMVKSLQDHVSVLVFETADEAWQRLCDGLRPHMILSEILLPGLDGREFFERVSAQARLQDLPFLFVTARGKPEDYLEYFRMGLFDIIQKPFSMKVLQHKVLRILSWVERKNSAALRGDEGNDASRRALESACRRFDLTERQAQIVALIAGGLGNKQIGDVLKISTFTVARHIQNIFERTGARSRLEMLSILNHDTPMAKNNHENSLA